MYVAIALFDIHCPYHDADALGLALEHILKKEPDELIIGGDFADCYQVSSWRKDPMRMSFRDEIEECRKLLTLICRKIKKFAKRVTFIKGNHEQRIESYLQSGAKELCGFEEIEVPSLLQLPQDWEYIDNIARMNNGGYPYQLGDLYILHGHEVKVSKSAVSLARLYWLKTYCNVLAGHHHHTDEYYVRRLDRKFAGAFTSGCLCNLSESYAPAPNWNWGFPKIRVDGDGHFSVRNYKIIEGKVL